MRARRLKILTGPHRGGELALPESGELSIGSDDACDLVFSDPSLAGRHALLRLGDQARLIPLEGTVEAGDVPLPAEGEPVVEFRVYSLGETQLSLGPEEGEWPAPAEPIKAEKNQAGETAASAAEVRPEPTRKRRPGKTLLAALALALGLALVLRLDLGLDRLLRPAEAWSDFQARLAEAGYDGLTLERETTGEMALKGWLDTEQQVSRLKETVLALRPVAAVKVEVGSVRALAADLSAQARALDYALLFIPERGGRIRVRGYAQNAEVAAGMRRTLELGSFVGDEWEIKTWADLVETLSALASARRLNFLRFEPRETSVAVTGLQAAPSETWAAFQEEIRDMLGLPLTFVPAPTTAEKPPPPRWAPPLPPRPAAVKPLPGTLCQGLSRDPANPKGLRLADQGTGYLEGGILPSGQRVVSVQPQGVFLEREGLMHYCPW